jgi:hypothetical protein
MIQISTLQVKKETFVAWIAYLLGFFLHLQAFTIGHFHGLFYVGRKKW